MPVACCRHVQSVRASLRVAATTTKKNKTKQIKLDIDETYNIKDFS